MNPLDTSSDPHPAPNAAAPGTPDREVAEFGAVHLEVTDLGRSTAFWTDVIGLVLRSESQDEVELGTKARTLVTLHPGARTGFLQGHSGLYHLAVHPPTEADFARILLRLIRVGWQISPTDHVMSKAIYLLDPDGITVEITLETPERLRGFHFDDNGPYVLRQDGSRSNGREPLDVRTVLKALPDDDTALPVPEGTKIGHVHLYVGDLEAAYGFYRTFGFNQAVWAPRFHMGDLGGGGAFNHRIAVNTWQGVGAPQSPAGTARMRAFTLRLDTHERLDHVLGTVDGPIEESDAGFLVRDPSLNTLLLSAN
ncbi:glyoxalase [Curtobacterium sp. MCPF17_011]|uniref:VOC family protein n=1 Tax=Curtobacterium sp. MCPF17_011 TaxID=2175652 RepID=UPI000DA83C05|nr:VOC family protein [Curtobacterium sp. MCPF17_011]PZF15540.1 glyoxalase [Curtobacterium sp. MCPF17_011]